MYTVWNIRSTVCSRWGTYSRTVVGLCLSTWAMSCHVPRRTEESLAKVGEKKRKTCFLSALSTLLPFPPTRSAFTICFLPISTIFFPHHPILGSVLLGKAAGTRDSENYSNNFLFGFWCDVICSYFLPCLSLSLFA